MPCTNKHENYAEISRKMRAIPPEKPNPSYEWEELVEKMCASDDVRLQVIGHREHDILNQNISRRKENQK